MVTNINKKESLSRYDQQFHLYQQKQTITLSALPGPYLIHDLSPGL